ncbi:MAG TPA: acyl-CoA dehydrogenase family protein, partial [Polyangiales bacterium]|nr:acyl-CoA dehydrogenase family protein [Polyangiales bacterium]
MPLTLSAEQQLLRDNANQFIREAAPVGQMRALRDRNDTAGFSRDLWQQMAQLGWASTFVPEAYGGLGLGYTEACVILEACGRTLASTPFLSSILLGAGCVLASDDSTLQRELLPPVAAGDLLLALAFEETPRFAPHHVSCRAERAGNAYRLHGRKTFVLDGGSANKLIVSARTSGAVADRAGISLFLVDTTERSLTLQNTRTIDSRSVATCHLEGVAAQPIGALDGGADILDPVLDRATIALCAEMLGLCTEAYEITIEYLKTRIQFDVPIGSFQALQHRAVDMFGKLELAKSVIQAACSAIDHQDRKELAVAGFASAAKARANDLSRLITREAIQMHGGIGMT